MIPVYIYIYIHIHAHFNLKQRNYCKSCTMRSCPKARIFAELSEAQKDFHCAAEALGYEVVIICVLLWLASRLHVNQDMASFCKFSQTTCRSWYGPKVVNIAFIIRCESNRARTVTP